MPGDFRFKDRLWGESGLLRVVLQLYLALARAVEAWLEEQLLDKAGPGPDPFRLRATHRRARALEPADSIPPRSGARPRPKGAASWTASATSFATCTATAPCPVRSAPAPLLRSAGTSRRLPGVAVHRSAVLELIQYAPQTEHVRRRPILLIPPQINKFYCFHLKPQNSAVAHLLQSGLQLFVISWRNPGAAEARLESRHLCRGDAGGDGRRQRDHPEPVRGTHQRLRRRPDGDGDHGLSCGAAVAARRPPFPAVTCLFPNEGSKLELFATPELLELARSHSRINGVMDGDALAKLFAWLRPTDLVWRYWINNYLLGKNPPPLDVPVLG